MKQSKTNVNDIRQMSVFEVFSGIELIYNNFNSPNVNVDKYITNKYITDNIMEISHCRKGRVECDLKDGTYLFLGEGDLGINMLNNHTSKMNFPTNFYEGISINLYLDIIDKNIPYLLNDTNINIYNIKKKLCSNSSCFVIRATERIEHIFSELYNIPESIKGDYLKIKVLELLLFLSVLDPDKQEKKEHFSKFHVETIKAIHFKITENFSKRYTIDELSKEFCISPTTLKLYFKEVYGTNISSYLINYRMKKASEILRTTNNSISQVAYDVGYESQSKFAIKFKEIFGMTPLEYRKKCSGEK
ncbi:helix-turn-helix domain-containing protein [Peptacetobacter sp.]|uniref:helix-turn-helix domain-containing protein n=1 Tax=Peptacetobacter sp. TaxID=2991975 RepID=UPI0026277433|nr:AraC family transcriptional regulator [Peptacetobacter sp.]